MPGYGFALAKEDVILAWADAMKHYLEERTAQTASLLALHTAPLFERALLYDCKESLL